MPNFPLELPKGIVSVSFEAQRSVAITRNPFTLQSYKQDWGGDRWTASASVQVRQESQIAEWRSFLTALSNGVGSFLLHDPNYQGAKGFLSIDAVVDGGGQTGETVDLRGMPASVVCLKAGDYFEISNRLYTVLEDCTSDAGGNCTVSIFPRLRDLPPDGTVVNFEYPKGRFRLLGSGSVVGQAQRLYRVSIAAEEDI